MKGRFTTMEWAQLKRLPPLLFVFVALADGRLQPEEAERFAAEISDANRYRDPLLRDLLSDLSRPAEFETAFRAVKGIAGSSADAIDREIAATKVLLKGKLSAEEYHRFFYCLLLVGKMVADAAGEEKKGGSGGHKPLPGMSLAEAESLGALAVKFAVDLDAGREAAERL